MLVIKKSIHQETRVRIIKNWQRRLNRKMDRHKKCRVRSAMKNCLKMNEKILNDSKSKKKIKFTLFEKTKSIYY